MLPAVRHVTHPRSSAPARAGGYSRTVDSAKGRDATAGENAAAPSPGAAPVLQPDLAATLADDIAQRAELLMATQRRQADARELAVDTMRTEFDLHEAERAELLREWNLTRDLAMEQMKKDDEIVKKWIALI
jgi:hypothetical protein